MKFLMDEHINPAIVRGLLRANPELDIVQASLEFAGTPDPELLEWAAQNGYTLVTRDVNTLVGYAYERIAKGIHTEAVFVLRQGVAIGTAIQELLLLAAASQPGEWTNQVIYVPLE